MTQARLLAFPLIETALLSVSLAIAPTAPWAALWLALPTALSLSLSLHISVHEHAHRRFGGAFARVVDVATTILVGVPFSGYAIHHFNHHAHVNGLNDYSSTFRRGRDGPRAQGPIGYALRWPVALIVAQPKVKSAGSPLLPRMRLEQLALLFTWVGLACFSPIALGIYAVVIYLGWCFVSLHNYAQHPPVAHGCGVTTSYEGRFYNTIFCNNGLHAEHHADSRIAWFQLLAIDVDDGADIAGDGGPVRRQRLHEPHLFAALHDPAARPR